ncbi:MAG: spore maturation protein [Lachnospiraceae bacterium]|nr:spore maturation protein [Lachnospiraceae bacterium]
MLFLIKISNMLIPILILYIVGFGILMKRNVYEDFIEGAKDGIKVVVEILPTLIGLMVGVGIIRASGFLEFLGEKLAVLTEQIGFPAQLMPLTIVKMFSSSAATGLLLDVYKNYGADSFIGMVASLMMSSTETIFYTMSVYFLAAKVKKTRWTLSGALICTLVGIIASVVMASINR